MSELDIEQIRVEVAGTNYRLDRILEAIDRQNDLISQQNQTPSHDYFFCDPTLDNISGRFFPPL